MDMLVREFMTPSQSHTFLVRTMPQAYSAEITDPIIKKKIIADTLDVCVCVFFSVSLCV